MTISDKAKKGGKDNRREKTRQELDGGEHHTARNRWTDGSESSTRRLSSSVTLCICKRRHVDLISD